MDNRVKNKIIQEISRLAQFWDMSEGTGMVYGTMVLSDRPLSMKDLSNATGYSISSISNHLNQLYQGNLIEKIKSNRQNLYASKTSFIEFYTETLKRSLDRDLKPLVSNINEFKKENLELKNRDSTFIAYIDSIIYDLKKTEAFLENLLSNAEKRGVNI
ncbi:MAG: GbsR/MarR family transcriptional regulator [Candidatus Methanofastidiosia archaeon]